MKKFPITKILLKNDIITHEKASLMESEEAAPNISEIQLLQQVQVIDEERLIRVLSDIFHLPIKELEGLKPPETLKEIPEDISQRLCIIPFNSTDEELDIAISDPTNINGIESLHYYTRKKINLWIGKESQILEFWKIYDTQSKSTQAVESLKQEFDFDKIADETIVDEENEDAPTIKLTNSIISEAIAYGASDVHIEPYEDNLLIRCRIDGNLKEIMNLPKSVFPAIMARLKLICGMDISERRIPQEGRLEMQMDNTRIDIRFSTLPNVFGEKMVMRLLKKKFADKSLEELGFRNQNLADVNKMLQRPDGIILVTGPTGSGKSTTLYAFLNLLKSPEKAIVTVEDPVEYTIEGFNQTQVNMKQGLTFPIALRAILRQDPDIIMIGEIRDEETAQIAVRSSITGHLVLSTLHTNSALNSIIRLIDMGIEPYLIADAIRGVIAQRLMRKLCPHCKKEHITTPAEMRMLQIDRPQLIYQAVGCNKCNDIGYKGRFPVFEVMYITPEIRKIIQEGGTSNTLELYMKDHPFTTLYKNGIQAVLNGDTSMQELGGLDDGE